MDRRIARSRRLLKGALSELLGERDYDGITVQEICDRADVARSTFYAHFESKEDLLFAGVDKHLMRLVVARPEERSEEEDRRRFRFTLPLLHHVRLQRRFFEATILGGSNARLREVSAGLFTDLVQAELDRLAPHGVGPAVEGVESRTLRGAYARTVVGAFMALLDWWLRSGDHLPAEAVDEIFQHFVAPALESARGS
ncbi:MAG: TetR/AcrR family transcriptional regulator [Gemmatimonadetes bacterium]|nr:TetR/AcrR family transcriptional regulator [Gemmatimonadota bacterium]